MRPKVFLVVTAILSFILGILFILMRDFAMGIAGAMGAGLIAQIMGANFIGWATLNLFGRNLEGEGLIVVLLANFISSVLGFLLFVAYWLFSGLNIYGYIAGAFYLVVALGFGIYLFYQPRPAMANEPCAAEPC